MHGRTGGAFERWGAGTATVTQHEWLRCGLPPVALGPSASPCHDLAAVVASGRTPPRRRPPDRYAAAFSSMPVALRPAVALPALLALATLVVGCDAAPGFADAVRQPTLAEVSISPLAVSLDTDAPTAAVPLTVSGTVDADAPVEVRVLVRWAETDSLVADVEQEVSPGAFSVEAPVVIPRGALGDYSVRISTEAADGRAGDQASAVLRFAAASLGPPTVTVAAPGPVTRPTGTATETADVVATVSDPDGRANIAFVVLQLPEGGGVIGRLFDGGEGSDDQAGDGRYSAGLVIDADFEPGGYALEVVAVDRAGEASAPAPFTLTVR